MTDDLPPPARPAWDAYQAMAITKQRHFEYLKGLEQKYEQGGRPSAQEADRLDQLLDQHDVQVRAFRESLRELRAADPDAHGALVSRLAREGQGEGH